MEWWNTAAPYLHAAGVVVALLLGAANLAWLIIQGRRSRETHAIAVEAHEWAREKRDAEIHDERERREAHERQAQADVARRTFWEDMRAAVDIAEGPIEVPDGTPREWVGYGEALGYYRRLQHPDGHVVLWRVKAE